MHATRKQYYLSTIYARLSTLTPRDSVKQMLDTIEKQDETSDKEEYIDESPSSFDEHQLNTELRENFVIDASKDKPQKELVDLQSTSPFINEEENKNSNVEVSRDVLPNGNHNTSKSIIHGSLEAKKETVEEKNPKEKKQIMNDAPPLDLLNKQLVCNDQTKNIGCNTSYEPLQKMEDVALEIVVSSAVLQPEAKSSDKLEVNSEERNAESNEDTDSSSNNEAYESEVNFERDNFDISTKLFLIDHNYAKKEKATDSLVNPSKNLNASDGTLIKSRNQCENRSVHSTSINTSPANNSFIPDSKKSADMYSGSIENPGVPIFSNRSEEAKNNLILDSKNHTSIKSNVNMELDNSLCNPISSEIQNYSALNKTSENHTSLQDLNCSVSEKLRDSVNNSNVISNIRHNNNVIPSESIRSNEDIGSVIEKMIAEIKNDSAKNKSFLDISSSENSSDSMNNISAISNIEQSDMAMPSPLIKCKEIGIFETSIDSIADNITDKDLLKSEYIYLPVVRENSSIHNSFLEEFTHHKNNCSKEYESVSQRTDKNVQDFPGLILPTSAVNTSECFNNDDNMVFKLLNEENNQHSNNMLSKSTNDSILSISASPEERSLHTPKESASVDTEYLQLVEKSFVEKGNAGTNEKPRNLSMPSLDDILSENQNWTSNNNIQSTIISGTEFNFDHKKPAVDHDKPAIYHDKTAIDHQNSKHHSHSEVSSGTQLHSPNASCSSPKRKHTDYVSHLASKRSRILKTQHSKDWIINFPDSIAHSTESLNRPEKAESKPADTLANNSSLYSTEICNLDWTCEIPIMRESVGVNASHSNNPEPIENRVISENINYNSSDLDSRSSSSSSSELKTSSNSKQINLNEPNVNKPSNLDNSLKDFQTAKCAVNIIVTTISSDSDDDIQEIEFINFKENVKNKSDNSSTTLVEDRRENSTSFNRISSNSNQNSLKTPTKSPQSSQTLFSCRPASKPESLLDLLNKDLNNKQTNPNNPIKSEIRTPKKSGNARLSNSIAVKKPKHVQTLLTNVYPANASNPMSSTNASTLPNQNDTQSLDPDCYVTDEIIQIDD